MWVVLFLIAGVVFFVAEAFLPTLGLLGILGFLCLIASIVSAGMISISCAIGTFIGLFVCLPPCVWIFAKFFPKTRLGRRLIPCPTLEDVQIEHDPQKKLQSLIGRIGVAKTPMLPNGLIEIEGQTYDAIAEGAAVETGQTVEVLEVRTRRLIVTRCVVPENVSRESHLSAFE